MTFLIELQGFITLNVIVGHKELSVLHYAFGKTYPKSPRIRAISISQRTYLNLEYCYKDAEIRKERQSLYWRKTP